MDLTKVCFDEGTIITPWNNIIRWHEIMSKRDVINWIRWVNVNICRSLRKDSHTTTGVKIRIATCMLNKLRSLSDEQKIEIHKNLTANVNAECFRIITEDLPF